MTIVWCASCAETALSRCVFVQCMQHIGYYEADRIQLSRTADMYLMLWRYTSAVPEEK